MTTDFSARSSTTPLTLADLPIEQQLQIRKSAAVLQRRWKGRMNHETIERFLVESLEHPDEREGPNLDAGHRRAAYQ